MIKLKILVASHKPDKIYQDDIYSPIHVGRSISSYKEEMSIFIGDDTGDNISEKNKSYCELTAVYWAWKNLKDAEYVGLAHYRRYFETKFTSGNIDKVFENCDVILAKPILCDKFLEHKLSKVLCLEDYTIFLSIIKKLYPEYEQTVIDYLYGYYDIPFNMFVMRRTAFENYSCFVFSILKKCEETMKPLSYTCSSRRLGYIAEFLLPIYCMHNQLRIHYENIVSMIGKRAGRSFGFKQKIKIALLRIIYDKHKPKTIEQMFDSAVIGGMKNDYIFL